MIGVAYAKELGAWIAHSFYAPEKFDQSVSKLCLLIKFILFKHFPV